jgi:hypothetical protein
MENYGMRTMLFILLVTFVPMIQSPDQTQEASDLVIQSFEWGVVRQSDYARAPELTPDVAAENPRRPMDNTGRPVNRMPGDRATTLDMDPWPDQRDSRAGDAFAVKEANALVKNIGAKAIKAVEWEFLFFSDDDPEKELKRYKFRNKIKIAPGETKFLIKEVKDRAVSRRRKARIIRIEYSDNSTWQRESSAK